MFTRLFLPAVFLASAGLVGPARAQVGLGTNSPAASAALHVQSSSRGLLPPRLTSAQRAAIAQPAPGLLVFQSDGTIGLYQYLGLSWVNLTDGHAPDATGSTQPANGALVSTLAGSGSATYANGTGTGASFDTPCGVAVDAGGTLYVADRNNHLIRKITPAGVVTTLAGQVGSAGSANGAGPAASFNNPTGVAVDAAGTIYVADKFNHLLRKITPAGVVSTLAGSGSAGSADGLGPAASFNNPTGVAVDAAGTIYVADTYNHSIRRVTPAGVVSTLAGSGSPGRANGIGVAASFNYPTSVAVDAGGTFYVADQYNQQLRKITAAGVVSTLAGSGGIGSANGTGAAASFFYPTGLAISAGGTLYVADQGNNSVRLVTPTGVVTTLAGASSQGSTNGTGAAASFFAPYGVAVDVAGAVYVADMYNNLLRAIR